MSDRIHPPGSTPGLATAAADAGTAAPSPIPRRRMVGLMAGIGFGLLPAAARSATEASLISRRARLKLLHAFDIDPHRQSGGAYPESGLIKANDGYLYGTAEFGGRHGYGTIYRMIDKRRVETVYSFGTSALDGARPVARLLQAGDGMLYGTTSYGTTSFSGTIFRLTTSGVLDTLHVFSGTDDGGEPFAPLIQAADGHLYGTTSTGGTGAAGTIFRISPAGAFSVIRRFKLDADGGFPYAGLLEGSDGLLYGTAHGGGAAGRGTAFRVSPLGQFDVLHHFTGTDGAGPRAELVLGPDGYFWGTTEFGGKQDEGTIFKLSADGSHQRLFSFGRNRAEGALPHTPLLLASDGYLYGTAGGTLDVCTVFRLDAAGRPAVLHTFPPYWAPDGELLEAEDGVLVGTLKGGGGNGYGAIYRLLDRADLPSA